MKKITFYIICLISVFCAFSQQRPIISSYQFNGLALNPAYAGSLNLFIANYIYRKQWVNIEGSPTSQILSLHNSFYSNQIGVGLQMTRDKIGIHEETSVYASYAYKIRTSAGILALGVSGGFDDRNSDFSQLNIIKAQDPLLSGLSDRFSPNFGLGVYFANPRAYIGVSVPYILEKSIYLLEGRPTQAKESRYYYGTAGYIFDITRQVKLSPSFLFRYQEESKPSWDINATIIFDEIAYAGISYRNQDALIFIMQLILNLNFRIGYAYDATTSPLSRYSRGTHEILLNYRIKFRNYRKDPQCPVYF